MKCGLAMEKAMGCGLEERGQRVQTCRTCQTSRTGLTEPLLHEYTVPLRPLFLQPTASRLQNARALFEDITGRRYRR